MPVLSLAYVMSQRFILVPINSSEEGDRWYVGHDGSGLISRMGSGKA